MDKILIEQGGDRLKYGKILDNLQKCIVVSIQTKRMLMNENHSCAVSLMCCIVIN